MAVHLSFFLILTGLTGIHGITTVSEVSVKAGGSISIPCLYGSQYRNHVKYLCKGYYFRHCSYAVKTNQRSSGKFLISDDKNQRIFTVTINDLMDTDADYWCAVEINGGSDVEEYFHLSVTRDLPRLYVDHQEITGFHGEKITINCFHHNSGEMKWCRLGGSCLSSSGSIDGTRVTINASSSVVTVTMSELTTDSSGWYLCVHRDLQMPVHLAVTEKPTTESKNPTEQPPNTDQAEQDSGTVDLKSFIIPLSLLIFTVMVTLFIWYMLKRQKQTKVESSATTTADEEVTYSNVKKKRQASETAEEEVTYSNVKHVRRSSRGRSDAEMKSDEDVTYSSVFALEQQNGQRVEAKAEDVTYSTLVHHQQNL
ncbi:polymeric immunoglobulin receptor-like isoform X2 [Chelmon rostratus]|uniref:polymeric immunoglobulin receptor-like isoform X2 n=1 Tax=Chelmon rostratus TaxID=109905 RepID=UPI001BEAA4B9|nr:polymeric immunoglobulin receptor-like isoform X2 [Chelmon rostratus]